MTPPSPLSPLVGADREMPHEPSRLLVAGDLHADESWFENLVYYAREQRCQAILQLGEWFGGPWRGHYIVAVGPGIHEDRVTVVLAEGSARPIPEVQALLDTLQERN